MNSVAGKRVVSSFSLVMAASMALTGCGGGAAAPAQNTFPSGNAATKIQWDDRTSGPEQDFRFRDKQWHLRNISAFSAWTVTQGNPELIVAVIDSGVDYDHPALRGKVIKGPDFGDNDNDPMDDSEHGTHVAGIIAADGDAKGIAPKVKIMAIKVFPTKDNPNQDWSDSLARAILYAAEHGASIINMSLGSNSMSRCSRDGQIDSAINEAFNRGVSVVVSAGNSAFDYVKNQCTTTKKNINTIPVVATNEMDRLADFSNYSNLDHPRVVAAPGVNIFSSVPTKSKCTNEVCELPWAYMQGTSMAAPVVAGTLAVIRSALYDDYVRVMKKREKQPLSFMDFFHRKQSQAMAEMKIAIPPARFAERLMFHFTSFNNVPSERDPANFVYDATRDPVLGFGRVDVGAAAKGASEAFTAAE